MRIDPKAEPAELKPLLNHGYELIRLHSWRERDAQGKSKGKIPFRKGWQTCPRLTAYEAENHMRRQGNVGVRLRETDLVIDVDPRNFVDGKDSAIEFEHECGIRLLDFPHVQTPSGGFHYYMQLPKGTKIQKPNRFPGIDFKTHGGYVVAPGSVHPNGNLYRWGYPSPDLPAPVAPLGVIRAICREKQPASEPQSEVIWLPQEIRKTLSQLDVQKFKTNSEWEPLMMAINEVTQGSERSLEEFVKWSISDPDFADHAQTIRTRWRSCSPGKDGNRSAGTLKKILHEHSVAIPPTVLVRDAENQFSAVVQRRQGRSVWGAEDDLLWYQDNDHGNAQRLKALCSDRLKYCHDFRKWLVWDERRWKVDATESVKLFCKETMMEFMRQATYRSNEKKAKFASQSLNDRRIRDMLAMAQSDLPVEASDLDQQRHLLNFNNGTVDLRKGELRPHDPSLLITKLVHYDYHPDAQAPSFVAFLQRIMGAGGSVKCAQMIAFLQKAFGYSLTAETSEKAVFVCWGNGNNGKTTLLELFRFLLSEYSTLIQINSLMMRTEDNASQSDVADLRGARLAITSETEEGQRLAEGKLKRITQGMGMIKARRLYENLIEFPETHKLWIDANHLPVVRGTDNAIWNRLHLIPFEVTISREERNPGLQAKLRNEAEGILAWAVRGAISWYRERLGRPPGVEEAVSKWQEGADPLKHFFFERCCFSEQSFCSVTDLRNAYEEWCNKNGEQPLDLRAFNRRLETMKCVRASKKIGGDTLKAWHGVALVGEFDSIGLV